MFIAPAQITVNPHWFHPEKILKYNQASGCFELFFGGIPEPRLPEGALQVYIGTLDVRTNVRASQQSFEELPSANVIAGYIGTPTYQIKTRAEWNHHDAAAAGAWNISIDTAQRLAMRQGIFQQLRNAALYGFNGSNGEGIINTVGATSVNLPADSNGNTTLLTYDNGQLALQFLQQIVNIKVATYQFGQPTHIVILGPQRILGTMELENVVQLTQFQRSGAGVATTAGMIQEVAKMNGDEVEFCYDDTLIGQGSGGHDLVIFTMQALKNPNQEVNRINTNEFAKLMPGLDACNVMFTDMDAPREIRSPLPAGGIDVVSELRSTSGWGLRPEATVLLSIQYQ